MCWTHENAKLSIRQVSIIDIRNKNFGCQCPLKLEIDTKQYIESVSKNLNKVTIEQNEQSFSGIIRMQDSDSPSNSNPAIDTQASPPSENGSPSNNVTDISPVNLAINNEEISSNNPNEFNPDNAEQCQNQTQTTGNTEMGSCSSNGACGFKLEKPKLPMFSGDVREYAIFKANFKHAIESRYSKRDAITMLRTCLKERPLELIKGIGSDYNAAWEYLDSIYADPRFVSDTITQDIMRFKALSEGEDARFCDLVHLVRRSYNMLKEVGIPSDMNNSHMLSIIEQKMCPSDRKVWSRELEREKKLATLINLIDWMTVEMKSRMRATAPVRSVQNRRAVYATFGEKNNFGMTKHKCWFCSSSNHWPDQCEKFAAKSLDERIDAAKNNHVCFSCL